MDDMQMQKEKWLADNIRNVVDHFCMENDMTYNQIIGILENIKMDYYSWATEEENEDE